MEKNQLVQDFWNLFILEEKQKRTEKERVYQWDKDLENRKAVSAKEKVVLSFSIKTKKTKTEGSFLLNEGIFVLNGRENSPEEFLQEMFSMLGSFEKVQFINLLEAAAEPNALKKILAPFFEELMKEKEELVKINWEVYNQASKFWNFAELLSFKTIVTEVKDINWKRKEQVFNKNDFALTKKTSFVFLWEGEEVRATIHYKEFETGSRKALFPYQMTLEGGKYKADELISTLFEKLSEENKKKVCALGSMGRLDLADAISTLLPIANKLESL